MARDGSSGGVIRMAVITPEGVERKFFAGEDIPRWVAPPPSLLPFSSDGERRLTPTTSCSGSGRARRSLRTRSRAPMLLASGHEVGKRATECTRRQDANGYLS